jgi:hypothetical protein
MTPRASTLLLAALAACTPSKPVGPAPSAYFGEFRSTDLQFADCFATALEAARAPSLLRQRDSTFRVTHVPWTCEAAEIWTLARTTTGALGTHWEATRTPTPKGPWIAADMTPATFLSDSRWHQWLDLRAEWHAFLSEGGHYWADLGADPWLVEWTDAEAYHWAVWDPLRDGMDRAVDWLAYVITRNPDGDR